MTKRTKKTPQEKIQELQAKMAQQQARIARQGNSDNPTLNRAVEARKELAKQIALLGRGFANGPQSFESRIEQHKLWIEEIVLQRDLAKLQRSVKSDVRADLDNLIDRLAAGNTSPYDDDILENILVNDGGSPEEAELNAAIHTVKAKREANKANPEASMEAGS